MAKLKFARPGCRVIVACFIDAQYQLVSALLGEGGQTYCRTADPAGRKGGNYTILLTTRLNKTPFLSEPSRALWA